MLTTLNRALNTSYVMFSAFVWLFFSACLQAQTPQYQIKDLHIEQQQQNTILRIKELFVAPDIHIEDVYYQCQGTVDLYPNHTCQEAELAFDLQQNRLQLAGQVNYDALEQVLKVNAVDVCNIQ